jgi:hypothetical protein
LIAEQSLRCAFNAAASQDRNIPAQTPRKLYSAKPLAPQLYSFYERRTLQLQVIDEKCQLSVLPKKSFAVFLRIDDVFDFRFFLELDTFHQQLGVRLRFESIVDLLQVCAYPYLVLSV